MKSAFVIKTSSWTYFHHHVTSDGVHDKHKRVQSLTAAHESYSEEVVGINSVEIDEARTREEGDVARMFRSPTSSARGVVLALQIMRDVSGVQQTVDSRCQGLRAV